MTQDTGVQPYYASNAADLGERYGGVPFEKIHADVLDLLPPAPARVADIGAGTGRDAQALAARGHEVVAVEPVREMREVARLRHPAPGVTWVEDSLPRLERLTGRFDLIMATAVWMHLTSGQRSAAMARLAELLAPRGLLVLSLRRGAPPRDRVMFDVPAEEAAAHAAEQGLELARLTENHTDGLGRAEVWWQTLVVRRPE
ncbi:class I SAM-dependent methyltransferase [Streptomyces sp. NPDC002734]|uniref:class I SAM-dependent methyltransferase n=1 Tax=Streptomyces sp. NPDC002734 TaxID=3154426 RepID=UPI003325C707